MFRIKIDTKGKLNERDLEDESAIAAIETVYNFPEDKVIFQWDNMDFIAYLSGNISDSWRDILYLMEDLKSGQKEISIQFPSQSFWYYWKFKEIENNKWEIEALWGKENQKKIKVEKVHFKKEFQKLIDFVETDLKKKGYDLFDFPEYQTIRKNDDDKILAWRKYPEPIGGNYYSHSLQKEFDVRILFDYCQILEAIIFSDGWDFLISKYGLKKLYEIDKISGWFEWNSQEEWLESILYQALISGMNIQTGNHGKYLEENDVFETEDGNTEKIDWEKFKTQKI